MMMLKVAVYSGADGSFIERDATPAEVAEIEAREQAWLAVADERAWMAVRAERDRLLAACDWTQVADAPLTAAQKTAWTVYRQALRDVPQDYATPDEVVWPTPPA